LVSWIEHSYPVVRVGQFSHSSCTLFFRSFRWVRYLLKACNPFLYEWNRQQHESDYSSAQLLWNTDNVLTLFYLFTIGAQKWTHRRPPGSKCDMRMGEFIERQGNQWFAFEKLFWKLHETINYSVTEIKWWILFINFINKRVFVEQKMLAHNLSGSDDLDVDRWPFLKWEALTVRNRAVTH
jgi:hypothetical protein